MTTYCQNAGRPCEHLATVVVRIPNVGDRMFCEPCYRALLALGMEVRRLDQDPVSLPAWRRHGLARDFTGRLLA